MMRRAANAALAPAAWLALAAWRDLDVDARRAAVVGGLAIGGALLNWVGICLSSVGLRRWLRTLSVIVGGLIALGLVVTALIFSQYVLPSVPKDETALRDAVVQSIVRFNWIAGATAYATCSVLLLPPERLRGTQPSEQEAPARVSGGG